MKLVKYLGTETKLGRFGTVKKGDTLELSEREYGLAMEDPENAKRFKILPVSKQPKSFLDHISGDSSEVSERSLTEKLMECSRDDLLDKALQIRNSGVDIQFRRESSRKELIRAIKNAVGFDRVAEGGILLGESEPEELPDETADDSESDHLEDQSGLFGDHEKQNEL